MYSDRHGFGECERCGSFSYTGQTVAPACGYSGLCWALCPGEQEDWERRRGGGERTKVRLHVFAA